MYKMHMYIIYMYIIKIFRVMYAAHQLKHVQI
jgi:hypothetical protein